MHQPGPGEPIPLPPGFEPAPAIVEAQRVAMEALNKAKQAKKDAKHAKKALKKQEQKMAAANVSMQGNQQPIMTKMPEIAPVDIGQ